MEFTIKVTGNRLALAGVGTLVLIVLILMLPNLLAQPLSRDLAEAELRDYFARQNTHRMVSQLRDAGVSAPDSTMAQQWQAGYDRAEELEIPLLEVRTFLLTPPFVSSRVYIVRAELKYPDTELETRYYTMTVASRIDDTFWIVERPAFWWWWSR